ncbi:hypothetical protein FOL47_001821 [Perkinsus chesapeaki]|uniref:Uncharacterized protein n=1 Tax=Perkinsus chesapeaki TaxID=330153 RepID=A0A7J6MH45_PERCH|nr:hypothetical protein FOL47_001821 [Perkinsus chesapeaki]
MDGRVLYRTAQIVNISNNTQEYWDPNGEWTNTTLQDWSNSSWEEWMAPFEYPAEIPLKTPAPKKTDTFLSRFAQWGSTKNPPRAKAESPLPYSYRSFGLLVYLVTPQSDIFPDLSYWVVVVILCLVITATLICIFASCARRIAAPESETPLVEPKVLGRCSEDLDEIETYTDAI